VSDITHGETLHRYRTLREVQRALNRQLTKTLSKKAIEETARRLGFWENGRILFEDEGEIDVLNDAALYDYFPAGDKNAVGRYFAQNKYEPGSGEYVVLEAMTTARVTLVELGEVVPGVGVEARDLLFGHQLLLADIGLSETAQDGMVLVTRLLEFEAFAMTTGVAQFFHREVADIIAQSFGRTMRRLGRGEGPGPKTRSRLGQVLFRWASLNIDEVKMELASMAAEDSPRTLEFERMLGAMGSWRVTWS
jgi:hypothetical protein